MKREFKISPKVLGVLSLFVVLLLCAQAAFSQCGTYFKLNYRAVNKITVTNGSYFVLGDWTGDGRSDFYNFQPNSATQTQNIIIYPGKQTGYWDWDNPIIYTTTIPVSTLLNSSKILKDFDSDGRIDFFFNNRIYRNAGNGSLTALNPVVLTSPVVLKTLAYSDINGDNLLDWIYSAHISPIGEELRYQLGTADGAFAPAVTILTASEQNGLTGSRKNAADFDGDGKIDIVYTTGLNYTFLKGLGNGNFQPPITNPHTRGSEIFSEVKDFNNDGRADILSINNYITIENRRMFVLFGQADGTLAETQLPLQPRDNDFFVTAELNGDNYLDVINANGVGFYSAYINNGNGTFTKSDYPGVFPNFGVFEDFSGDGKADFYVSSHPTNLFGEEIIGIREGNCQTFKETQRANFDGIDDFRTTDLLMWNPETGDWSSKDGRWLAFQTGPVLRFNWGLGSLGDVPAPGDYDGDGFTDYGVYRNSNGTWYVRQSSNGAWSVLQFGLPGDIAVPNDYDGGGKTDFAVFRPSNGVWYFWFTETQSFGAAQFGASGDKPVPADYDGDGKADAAVYRPSEGNWYFLRSTDFGYGVVNWGLASDKPLPADFDGDGKADFAVFRDGSWYILRSMNLSFNFIQWGTTGDVPVSFYRNTMSSDLVVYRPSQRVWYNSAFTRFGVIVEQFGAPGDAPVNIGLPNN